MASGYWSPLAIGMADGPPIGASSGAQSCIPVTARYTFPPNSFMIGSALRITALGRYTTTTTPGTATWSVVLGGVAGVFTSGAYALNVTLAKTNLPFWLDIVMVCRSVGSGTAATFFGFCRWQTESFVGSPLETVGGTFSGIGPVSAGAGTPPVVGAGFDSTVSNSFDFQFAPTVTTGSMTIHNFLLESGAIALT